MNEDFVMIPCSGTKTIVRDVKDEIESAFLDYSMSVIVSRALNDVRDGVKPDDIVILSPVRNDRSVVAELTDCPISLDPDQRDGQIFFSTIHRFKGL